MNFESTGIVLFWGYYPDRRSPVNALVHPDGDPNSFGVMSCRRVCPFLAQPNRVATSGEVY
jgi:hypothetical protein